MTKTASLSLGPRAIAHSSIADGPGFSLSSPEWIKIQVYVKEALGLPTNLDELKKALGEGAPKDMSDFSKLTDAYADIHTHVKGWEEKTFPASVSLASDIYNYALLVPTYYDPIKPLAEKLYENPDDQVSKDELTAILNELSKNAATYQGNANSVHTKIEAFFQKSEKDKEALSGDDGKGGLVNYYYKKYGAESEEIKKIIEEIKAQQKILDAANAEYDYDVVVAATTPVYLVGTMWFDLIIPSLVSAAVVAGVYGDKATKALETIRAAEQQIKNLNEKEKMATLLMTTINTIEMGITSISASLTNALPVIKEIEKVWDSLAKQLDGIVEKIKTNIKEALPILMELGVESAKKEWKDVEQEADEYRRHAYITVEEEKK